MSMMVKIVHNGMHLIEKFLEILIIFILSKNQITNSTCDTHIECKTDNLRMRIGR
jgi:hypothetical protein